MVELTFDQKQSWIKSLLIDCPVRKPLEECPVKGVRALPIEERLKLVDSMDNSQLDQMVSHHMKWWQQVHQSQ